MKKAAIIGYSAGDVVRLGPATIRILEDGSTTGHRLGIIEITLAPDGGVPSPEAGAEVMSRYATEIADTYAGSRS